MTGQRYVFIDPDGTLPHWMFVLIECPTGVIYEHQYGGTATRQGAVEGYLVPVDGRVAASIFDDVFVRHLRSVGSWGKPPEEDLLGLIREAVATVRFWPSAQGSPPPENLALDDRRLNELDEAWLPIVTSDGRGLLIWPNSD